MSDKPLGGKAYGSIPHLLGSRLGPGDHHCHEGQSLICTGKSRDKHDRIIVTEKLDGACVSVANVDGEIVALIRAGYMAEQSPRPFLRAFAVWVKQREALFHRALGKGARFCGEWLISPHGTLYAYSAPFVAFDLIVEGERRPYVEFRTWAGVAQIQPAELLWDEPKAFPVQAAMRTLGSFGHHGALERPEGAVWRVERKGKFDFMAKYVRPDKVDGKYFEQENAA